MKKIDKKTLGELAELYKALDTSQGDIEDAINMYNETIYELNEALKKVGEDIESYMEDRSEKWKESERADLYQEWFSFFEDEKDEIDEPYFEHGELEDIPVEIDLL